MNEKEIKKIVDDLLVGEKLKSNELTIKDKFVKGYIDGKYYNLNRYQKKRFLKAICKLFQKN